MGVLHSYFIVNSGIVNGRFLFMFDCYFPVLHGVICMNNLYICLEWIGIVTLL